MPKWSKDESAVNHLYGIIVNVLGLAFYECEISPGDLAKFDRAARDWQVAGCQRTDCRHRGDTCSFHGRPGWVRGLKFADLCELLHAPTWPDELAALRAHWARQPGNFNP